MPKVNSQTPNSSHRMNAAQKRVKFTGLCLNCGNKVTFCGRPFTADVRCAKCSYINHFDESQQPIKCWPEDTNANVSFLS